MPMSSKKVWFVTGAGRGMGVDIAKAALAAGHAVVATGRSTEAVTKALGTSNDLLVLKLDVTRPDDAHGAVSAAATISSTGGITGQAFVSAYSAAKFGAQGWMQSLAQEIAPFGLHTMLVEPGFFRTELLTDQARANERSAGTWSCLNDPS